MADYKWKPIEDLPDDWTKLASSELGGLAAVWVEHYETIKDSKALKQFNERLRREWAIETGIIENLYYIDRGVTLTLIEKGIEASLIPHGSTDRPAELIVPILKDHEEVVTGLFDFVGQQRQLSTSYIKQLHQALTQHQRTTAAKDNFGTMMEVELLRGDWKKLPNNPTKSDDSIHEYCPPEQVASEMDRLISLHQEHLEKGVPPEVEAAWLHHRFTQIHPFQDGNGRMARTLASLVFLRAGLFPLVVHLEDRDLYLDVLFEADFGDLKPIVQFFSRAQKKAINQALGLSENVLLEATAVEQVISVGVERLRERKRRQAYNKQPSLIVSKLEQITQEKLVIIANRLDSNLKEVDSKYSAQAVEETDNLIYDAFDLPAIRISRKAGYLFNPYSYKSWFTLRIQQDEESLLVVSIHTVGLKSAGINAVSAFYFSISNEEYFALSDEVFQFTQNEPEESVIERFNIWLDEVILNGLSYWQQQL